MGGYHGGVLVVDPNMVPPGYILGQVAAPRVEEPEEPLYVNAKQYLHESRHKHAMRRPRGPGGRFLTAAEIAALEEREKGQHQHGLSNHNSNNNNGDGHHHHQLRLQGRQGSEDQFGHPQVPPHAQQQQQPQQHLTPEQQQYDPNTHSSYHIQHRQLKQDEIHLQQQQQQQKLQMQQQQHFLQLQQRQPASQHIRQQ
ncbi:Transcriptional activator [Podila clonocystis]|nr:Transcriptional activator [Podila clonocystis]